MFVAHTPNSLCSVPHSSHRTDGPHFLYPTSVGGRGACSHLSAVRTHAATARRRCSAVFLSLGNTPGRGAAGSHGNSTFFYFLKRFYLFSERGEGREKERERNINVWLPLAHPLQGTWPATQACALTGNRTGDLSARRPVLNPLSHTSQGSKSLITHTVS